MATTGYDVFFTQPNTEKDMHCAVCGALCEASWNGLGPMSGARAMAGKKTLHDEFWCPHSETAWHAMALVLVMAGRLVAGLLRKDLKGLLRGHAKAGGKVHPRARLPTAPSHPPSLYRSMNLPCKPDCFGAAS